MAKDEEAAVPMTAGMGSLVYKGHWPNVQEQFPCTGNEETSDCSYSHRGQLANAQIQAVTDDLESPYTSTAVRRDQVEKKRAS